MNKFFISFSAFTFLIIATAISYSPIFHSRSLLLDIPNAMALSAQLEKEQDRHDPFLLATPSLTSSPTPPLSDSLPFGTITGSEIRQQPQEQELQSLSNSHNNKNPS
ncbi:MAG TPA: hypothetical protein VIP56_09255, partial [Nitrososphaeraceae archaeon]